VSLLVPWPNTLQKATLIRRRHRFLLDAELDDGTEVTAYCGNPGSMESLVRKGAQIWLCRSSTSRSGLSWTWETVQIGRHQVATNSVIGNRAAAVALRLGLLCGLDNFDSIAAEVSIPGGSRVDFELRRKNELHLVEVKGAHLVYPDKFAYFPDSLTVRSVGQLRDISARLSKRRKATLLVVVPRSDAKGVCLSDAHDPDFAEQVRLLVRRGLSIRAMALKISHSGLHFHRELPVRLEPQNLQLLAKWKGMNKSISGWERPPRNREARWRNP
jgi:sugar fermentation stimulation protein A